MKQIKYILFGLAITPVIAFANNPFVHPSDQEQRVNQKFEELNNRINQAEARMLEMLTNELPVVPANQLNNPENAGWRDQTPITPKFSGSFVGYVNGQCLFQFSNGAMKLFSQDECDEIDPDKASRLGFMFTSPPVSTDDLTIKGNEASRLFYPSNCQGYSTIPSNREVSFSSPDDAANSGFTLAPECQ